MEIFTSVPENNMYNLESLIGLIASPASYYRYMQYFTDEIFQLYRKGHKLIKIWKGHE